jgi:formylglycine-generating enzyme required for sulfatase activity
MRETYGDHLNDMRIPTKYEWIVAAKGGQNSAIYSWGGPYVQNAKGCYLGNFLVIGEHNIQSTDEGLEITQDSNFVSGLHHLDQTYLTAPATSYAPNNFGLYNMCGNVAELTSDGKAIGGHWNAPGYDIRITSRMAANEASPFVGFRPIMTYLALKK